MQIILYYKNTNWYNNSTTVDISKYFFRYVIKTLYFMCTYLNTNSLRIFNIYLFQKIYYGIKNRF